MEGQLAVCGNWVVGVEDVVLHAGQICHVREHLDQNVFLCDWCGREINDMCRNGLGEPRLQLRVVDEVGRLGVESVDNDAHEVGQLSLDHRCVFVEREEIERRSVRALDQPSVDQLRFKIVCSEVTAA